MKNLCRYQKIETQDEYNDLNLINDWFLINNGSYENISMSFRVPHCFHGTHNLLRSRESRELNYFEIGMRSFLHTLCTCALSGRAIFPFFFFYFFIRIIIIFYKFQIWVFLRNVYLFLQVKFSFLFVVFIVQKFFGMLIISACRKKLCSSF